MSKNLNFDKIKENVSSFKDRMEIGLRMLVKLLIEEKNEHVMVISFTLFKNLETGKIESITHTSPGNGENVLRAALDFYVKHNAEAHEETLTENT